jgi:hypothetical protein
VHLIVRRRSAYALVLQGIPIWFTCPQPDISLLRWHIHWLYRLGTFIGWVDDCVDIFADWHAHAPNVLLSTLTLPLNTSVRDVALHFAKQGERILSSWYSHTPENLHPLHRIFKAMLFYQFVE